MQPSYEYYLKSPEWAEKRKSVIERANGKCERCGETRPPLEVHHLTYQHIFDEPLDDLQLVCKGCHEFLHLRSDYDPAKGRWIPLPETVEMPFGKWKGYKVAEVPKNYLFWAMNNCNLYGPLYEAVYMQLQK